MRLVSYNIHKGIGGRDWRYRLERVWEVIEALEPDLVCLQEVTWQARRTRRHDQPALLARQFGALDGCFQLNVRYRRGGYGNLLLSRWPLRTKHDVCLRLNRRKPRGAQLAVVDAPGGQLALVNWHLGLAERERHWQAGRLLRHPAFGAAAHLPALVVGDCNDWRDTLARGPLGAHGFSHATGPASRFRSFPAWMPLLALDKAFHRGGVVVGSAGLVGSPLARRASDHLPLVVDFDLAGHSRQSGPLAAAS
jgi:endonuclease/exonuclease/phosphatase family metal-dependent hydrolase